MADIVLGLATSHTPDAHLARRALAVVRQERRAQPRARLSAARAGDAVQGSGRRDLARRLSAGYRGAEPYRAQSEACQRALDELSSTLRAVNPDITVIIGDDQDEWFFEDNMPALSGLLGRDGAADPRTMPPGSRDAAVIEAIRRGYGDVAMDVPVASGFGRYLIEYLIEHDFDVAHMRYVKQPYGGSVARRYPTKQGELDYVRETRRAAAGAAARVLVRRQAALRQQARRDPAGVPEHLLPAEPADAAALVRDRRSDRRRDRRMEERRVGRRSSPRAGSATSSSTRSSTAGCSARSSGTMRRRCARSRAIACTRPARSR